MLYDKEFSFDIDVRNKDTYDIFDSIDFFSNHFDKNDYAEKLYENNPSTNLKISEIAYLSNYIDASLCKLTSDILYKCRYLEEERKYNLNHKTKLKENYLIEQDVQKNYKESEISNGFEL